MILSNTSIQAALDNGSLVIDPEPAPRTATADQDCPYQTTAVDLRLSDELVRFREGRGFAIDLRQGSFGNLSADTMDRFIITEDQPFRLQPGDFVLGRTLERIGLPLREDDGPCLAARIEGRSSYARCGLVVHLTAPTIHAGFEGTLTLEMRNLGAYPILLQRHDYVCQLIIEEVHGRPFRNDSQFQGQAGPGGG